MKIVLDTTILVRANEHSQGLVRELLTNIVASEHTLLLSNEMLHELAKVLPYPLLQMFYEIVGLRIREKQTAPPSSQTRRRTSQVGQRVSPAGPIFHSL